jgi:integrase
MTRHNLLNKTNIPKKLKIPRYHLDGQGLYLRVTRTLSANWVLRYPYGGKTREMGLGPFRDLDFEAAREYARKWRLVLRDGIDPIQQRKSTKAKAFAAASAPLPETPNVITFEQCAREFHKDNKESWKNEKHRDQWINTISTHAFPHFGAHPIASVGKQEILKALSPIWKEKAETADRLLQRIRKVFIYGAAKDYCPGMDGEYWKQIRIALGNNSKERKATHHPSCPHQDVGSLLEQVRNGTATPMVRLAFEFGVLTAARSGEIRGAVWSEFDEALANWVIPAERMKAQRDHRVPLSGRATELLQAARTFRLLHRKDDKAAAVEPNDLVFPAPRSGKKLSDMALTQLLRRMELPGEYTMHGFRASFRTWAMDMTEYPSEMLEHALAHQVGDQTVRAYARGDMFEKRRRLMEDWAAYVAGQTAGSVGDEAEATPQAHIEAAPAMAPEDALEGA